MTGQLKHHWLHLYCRDNYSRSLVVTAVYILAHSVS